MNELQWLDIFGDNLARMMVEEHMTQRELAELSGLSESTISRFVNKQMMPNVKSILNLSYALHCTMDELADFGAMMR